MTVSKSFRMDSETLDTLKAIRQHFLDEFEVEVSQKQVLGWCIRTGAEHLPQRASPRAVLPSIKRAVGLK